MVETISDYTRVEKLLSLAADNQKFAKPKDKLTLLIEKFSGYLSEELDDKELDYIAAAKMLAVPKYKSLK